VCALSNEYVSECEGSKKEGIICQRKEFTQFTDRRQREIINQCEKIAIEAINPAISSRNRDKNSSNIFSLLFGRTTWSVSSSTVTTDTPSTTTAKKDVSIKNHEREMIKCAASPFVRNALSRFKKAKVNGNLFQAKSFLSLFYPFFTLKFMNTHCLGNATPNFGVSRREWHAVNLEAKSGHQDVRTDLGMKKRKSRAVGERVRPEIINSAIHFIMQTQIERVANGTHVVPYSTGRVQLLPACVRKYTLARSYQEYLAHEPNKASRLSQINYEYALKTVAPKITTASVAVDPVHVKCNLKTFEEIKTLIKFIAKDLGTDKEMFLLNLASNVQEFLQYDYWHHLVPKDVVSRCVSHNLTNLCSYQHERKPLSGTPLFCKECDEVPLLFEELLDAVDAMRYRSHPTGEGQFQEIPHDNDRNTRPALRTYIYVLRKNVLTYQGHVVRKLFQHKLFDTKIVELDDTGFLIIADWKMKILAMLFVESQTEFFGKRGMPLHGTLFLWKDPATGIIHAHFFDVILADDNKENADASIASLLAAIQMFKERVPGKDHCSIFTDGAATYSCFDFMYSLSKFVNVIGIRVDNHYLSEAGCGKTAVDGHFSFLNRNLALAVLHGRGEMDIVDPHSLQRAYLANPVANSSSELISFRRFNNRSGELGNEKVLSCLHRAYTYTNATDGARPELAFVTFRPLADNGNGIVKTAACLAGRVIGQWNIYLPITLTVEAAEIQRASRDIRLQISDEDKAKVKRIRHSRLEKKNTIHDRKQDNIIQKRKKVLAECLEGGLLFCPQCDVIYLIYVQKTALDEHIKKCYPLENSWTPETLVVNDNTQDHIIENVLSIHQSPSQDTPRVRNSGFDTSIVNPTLTDHFEMKTKEGRCFRPTRFDSALKMPGKKMTITSEMYQFVLDGYEIGSLNPHAKVQPDKWRKVMMALGKVGSVEKFPEYAEFMQRAIDKSNGWPSFGLHEIFSVEQFKSYFARTKAELQKTLQNAIEREEKLAKKDRECSGCGQEVIVEDNLDTTSCTMCGRLQHLPCIWNIVGSVICERCVREISETHPDKCCAACHQMFDNDINIVTCSVCESRHHLSCISQYDFHESVICDACCALPDDIDDSDSEDDDDDSYYGDSDSDNSDSDSDNDDGDSGDDSDRDSVEEVVVRQLY